VVSNLSKFDRLKRAVPVPYARKGILVPSFTVTRGSGLVTMMSCGAVRS